MGCCIAKEKHLTRPKVSKMIDSSLITRAARLESTFYLDINDFYTFIKVLGHGQYGTVREAIRKQQNTIHSSLMSKYAVKSILKARVKQDLGMLRKELEVLQTADHPNIVKLYEVFEDSKYIHLIMEHCSGGDLFEHVMEQGQLTEKEVAEIMKKLLSAVEYLHTIRVSHRDLKPENFMYNKLTDKGELKLVDFGMSGRFDTEDMHSMVGTPYYLAPEIISGIYGKECDIWSLGVVCYFLLSGKQPFGGADMRELLTRIREGDYNFFGERWKGVSSEAINLIEKMLVVNPARRIEIPAALNHQWFKKQNPENSVKITPNVIKSIRKFKAPTKLYEESLKILVRNLNQDEMKNLEEMFSILDTNNTGYITADDLEQAVRENGFKIAHGELVELIEKIDYLGHGKLNYTEFVMCAINRRNLLDEEALWFVFSYFDTVRFRQARTGKISHENLKTALERAGCVLDERELESLVDEFGLEKDIGFSEENSPDIRTPIAGFDRSGTKRLSVRRFTLRRNQQ